MELLRETSTSKAHNTSSEVSERVIGLSVSAPLYLPGSKKGLMSSTGLRSQKGFRLQNGWQNSGLPWSMKMNPDKMYRVDR